MKTYKIVTKHIEDKVYCDMCGNDCCIDQINNEYATLEALWGYGSDRDGEKFDIQLCINCFNETLEMIKKRRKQHLGPFTYAYHKDPLMGGRYDCE